MDEKATNQINTKDLLKLFGVGAAAVLAPAVLERETIGQSAQLFADPDESAKILTLAANLLGNERENPHFLPMRQIIVYGVQEYEKQIGKKVFFQRDEDYRDYPYYQKEIAKARDSIGLFPDAPENFVRKLVEFFPNKAKRVFAESDRFIENYGEVITVGGGMLARFNKDVPNPSDQDKKRENKGKEYISEVRAFVEGETVKNNNKPVSASKILTFFLIKNDGNLGQSLTDTYIFLKFSSRNGLKTGRYFDQYKDQENIDWMRSNILDEYGSKPYNEVTDDLLNSIGKPYHSWNLVAMLPYFPTGMIQLAGLYRQTFTFEHQGKNKIHADLVTLADLSKIEDALVNKKSREILPSRDYSGVRFEPGQHEVLRAIHGQLINDLRNGKLSPKWWNSQVARRMKSYQPQIISIDGFSPTEPIGEASHKSEELTWIRLPCRPREIGLSSFFVVRGDLLGNIDVGTDGNSSQVSLQGLGVQTYEFDQRNFLNYGELSLGPPLIFILAFSAWTASKIRRGPEMTRREFLQWAWLGATGLGLSSAASAVRMALPSMASIQPSTQSLDIFLKAADLAKASFFQPGGMVDARTAIAIQKNLDSIDQLNLPKTTPSSLLYGSQHGWEVVDLMYDTELQSQKILEAATTLVGTLNQIVNNLPDQQIDEKIARNKLLDLFSAVSILKISDPGDPPYEPSPSEAIARNIQEVASFQSPRVEAIIQNLR